MIQKSNNQRAQIANAALSTFINEIEFTFMDDQTATAHLLAHFLHLADAQQWVFDNLMKTARHLHSLETLEQPPADPDFAK